MDPLREGESVNHRGREVDHVKQRGDAVKSAKLLVQRGHLLTVGLGVPASFAILLLLLPSLSDASLRGWQEDSPIGESGDEDCGQGKESSPSIGWIKQPLHAAGGPKMSPRQCCGKDDG